MLAIMLAAAGVGQVMLAAPVQAEDNNPNPPPPKPKDPPTPPDPCAGSKQQSACRNAAAVRALLREAAPPDPTTPAERAATVGGSVAVQP